MLIEPASVIIALYFLRLHHMIHALKRYKELTRSQKIHIIIFVMFLAFITAQPVLNWRRALPLESELQYTVGTLDYQDIGDGDILVTLWPTKKIKDVIVFGCSHAANNSGSANSCMGHKSIAPYVGKRAKIGWYDQPSALGLKNNLPQMVTLLANGDYVKTYEGSKQINANQNKGLIWIALIFYVLSGFLFIKLIYPTA